jgi:translation initiation factor 4G
VCDDLTLTIQDIIDLRAAGWKGNKATSSVKTIAEIHQEAAREQAQKSAATNASVSRQSSNRGHPRNGPGDWQTSQSAAPRQQRPADFSNIGRLASSTGAPNFAPQSAFKNRRNGANVSTPPISRQPSQANIASVTNANPFALLNENSEAADTSEPAPQRKKLNLKPRTKPVEGEAGDAAEEEEGDESGKESGSEDEVTTPTQSTEMTETAAKAKIDIDMKELWGEKDQGGSRNPADIVHYFRALPETRRPLLVSRLLDEVFRLAKLKDAQVVAKAFSAAVEEGVAATEQLKSGYV